MSFSFSSYSQCDEMIIVPNAFTPNNDGVNDIWYPVVNLRQNFLYDLTIYNRNGEKIFKSTDIKRGWVGENLTNNVFTYHIIIKYRWIPIGEYYTCEKIGTITLIK